MQLMFSMPNLVQLKAMGRPWERTVTGADQTRLAQLADELGFAMIPVPEHHVIPRSHVELSGGHYLSALPAMAHWAGATQRIRVNSCISILPLQNPVVLAKALATMDWLSSGRVTITFGVGWLEQEFELLGVPFHQRGAIADEYVQAIIALWTQEEPEFDGRYVSFRDVVFEPKPVQDPHPPVWFGGDADAVLRRVGRHATGWWPFLTPPEEIPAKLDYIRSQPDHTGALRDVVFGFETTKVGEGHAVQDDPRLRDGMTKDEIIDRLGWFAELGVTVSSVPIPSVGSVEEYADYTHWVAAEILPAVASL